MNQSIDNDLQKAIEDITKSTNADPVFADTVAGPAAGPAVGASAPVASGSSAAKPAGAGMDGVARGPVKASAKPITAAPVTANPIPRPVMPRMGAMPPAAPRPSVKPVSGPVSGAAMGPITAGTGPMTMPGPISGTVTAGDTVAPMPVDASMAKPAAPVTAPVTVEAPKMAMPEAAEPVAEAGFTSKTVMEDNDMIDTTEVAAVETSGTAMDQVKAAALRDLAPLLDKMEVAPTQKFGLYRTMVEDLHDSSVLPSAYHAASEIADDKERGEALLYLVETIDKM